MATALQQQMLRIREGNSGTLPMSSATSARKTKGRASLLFHPREAEDVDNETIYGLGLNGLIELSQINGHLTRYENALFTSSRASLQRSMLTKEEDRDINELLDEFFGDLSPYFLMKPCHKVIEYLIRVYEVQIYNVESVMRCILPFHETAIFARMVSILHLEEGTRWSFLKKAQESGAPLARAVLAERCCADKSVLAFVIGIARNTPPEGLKTALSLYTLLVMEVLQRAPTITEDMLRLILPAIFEGVKVTTSREEKLAAYMILSLLSSRLALTQQALVPLVNAITRSLSSTSFSSHNSRDIASPEQGEESFISPDVALDAILCVIRLFQTQEELKAISHKAYFYLCHISLFRRGDPNNPDGGLSFLLSSATASPHNCSLRRFLGLFLGQLVNTFAENDSTSSLSSLSSKVPRATALAVLRRLVADIPFSMEVHAADLMKHLLDACLMETIQARVGNSNGSSCDDMENKSTSKTALIISHCLREAIHLISMRFALAADIGVQNFLQTSSGGLKTSQKPILKWWMTISGKERRRLVGQVVNASFWGTGEHSRHLPLLEARSQMARELPTTQTNDAFPGAHKVHLTLSMSLEHPSSSIRKLALEQIEDLGLGQETRFRPGDSLLRRLRQEIEGCGKATESRDSLDASGQDSLSLGTFIMESPVLSQLIIEDSSIKDAFDALTSGSYRCLQVIARYSSEQEVEKRKEAPKYIEKFCKTLQCCLRLLFGRMMERLYMITELDDGQRRSVEAQVFALALDLASSTSGLSVSSPSLVKAISTAYGKEIQTALKKLHWHPLLVTNKALESDNLSRGSKTSSKKSRSSQSKGHGNASLGTTESRDEDTDSFSETLLRKSGLLNATKMLSQEEYLKLLGDFRGLYYPSSSDISGSLLDRRRAFLLEYLHRLLQLHVNVMAAKPLIEKDKSASDEKEDRILSEVWALLLDIWIDLKHGEPLCRQECALTQIASQCFLLVGELDKSYREQVVDKVPGVALRSWIPFSILTVFLTARNEAQPQLQESIQALLRDYFHNPELFETRTAIFSTCTALASVFTSRPMDTPLASALSLDATVRSLVILRAFIVAVLDAERDEKTVADELVHIRIMPALILGLSHPHAGVRSQALLCAKSLASSQSCSSVAKVLDTEVLSFEKEIGSSADFIIRRVATWKITCQEGALLQRKKQLNKAKKPSIVDTTTSRQDAQQAQLNAILNQIMLFIAANVYTNGYAARRLLSSFRLFSQDQTLKQKTVGGSSEAMRKSLLSTLKISLECLDAKDAEHCVERELEGMSTFGNWVTESIKNLADEGGKRRRRGLSIMPASHPRVQESIDFVDVRAIAKDSFAILIEDIIACDETVENTSKKTKAFMSELYELVLNTLHQARQATQQTESVLIILGALSEGFFASLNLVSNDARLRLLVEILSIAQNGLSAELVDAAQKALHRFPLSAEEVRHVIMSNRDDDTTENLSGLECAQWKLRCGLILEQLASPNGHPAFQSLPALCHILEALAEVMHKINQDIGEEYLKQLTLDVLGTCYQHLSIQLNAKVPDSFISQISLQISTLAVEVVSATQNPQTRSSGLLALSSIAKVFPDKVLGLILPALTVVSSSVLAQDDGFSFYVVQKLVEHVVPHVNKRSFRERQQLLAIFVKEFPVVSPHRRVPLFEALARTVGAAVSIPVILSLALQEMIKSIPTRESFTDPSKTAQQHEISSKGNDVRNWCSVTRDEIFEFIHTVCNRFSAQEQISTVLGTLHISQHLATSVCGVSSSGSLSASSEKGLGGMPGYSPDGLSPTKIGLLNEYLLDWSRLHLETRSLHHQVLTIGEATSGADVLQRSYLLLAQNVLLYIRSLNSEFYDSQNGKAIPKQPLHIQDEYEMAKRRGESLAAKAFEILKTLQQLMSVPGFLAVISELLHHDDSELRRKALMLFNQKVEEDKDLFSESEVLLFLEMLKDLREILASSASLKASLDIVHSSAIANFQTALLSVDVLARAFAGSRPEAFSQVLESVVDFTLVCLDISSGNGVRSVKRHTIENPGVYVQLLSSSFLCISTLSSSLGPRLFPVLPRLVPRLLSVIEAFAGKTFQSEHANTHDQASLLLCLVEDGGARSSHRQLLIQSVLVTLHAITTHVPQFLHPYLKRTILAILSPTFTSISAGAVSPQDVAKEHFENKSSQTWPLPSSTHVKHILDALVDKVEGKHLIAVLFEANASLMGSAINGLSKTLTSNLPGEQSELSARKRKRSDDSQSLESRILLEKSDAQAIIPAIFGPLLQFFHFTSSLVQRLRRAQIPSHYRQLVAIFISMLDLRRRCFSVALASSWHRISWTKCENVLSEIQAVEDGAVECIMHFVLKLNEKELKPLFLKIFEWANLKLSHATVVCTSTVAKATDPVGVETSDGKYVDLHRQITFSRLVGELADRLKSIFVPYFGFVLDDLVRMLACGEEDKIQKRKPFSQQLVYLIKNGSREPDWPLQTVSDDEDAGDDFFVANGTHAHFVLDRETTTKEPPVDGRKRKRGSRHDDSQESKDEISGVIHLQVEASLCLSLTLRQVVMEALGKCFLYSEDMSGAMLSENFISKERFHLLCAPLVNQLDVAAALSPTLISGSSDPLKSTSGLLKQTKEFVVDTVIPCLARFFASARDDSLWKSGHHSVLMKSRSDASGVRWSCLHVLRECYKTIGEEFLVMLPESIPFLAELLEDDDIEVERLCRRVIQEIEELSGEKLDTYMDL